MQLIDVNHTILSGAGETAVQRRQEIPDDFLDHLSDLRHASTRPAGEYHQVASIPAALVEHWLLVDGFDVYRASAKDIVAKLRRHDLDAFIATRKRVA